MIKIVDRKAALAVAVGRIVIGIIYFWAGLEKLTNGDGKGGPWTAAGFLKGATGGTLSWPFVSGTPAEGTVFNPTHDLWVNLAGNSGAMTIINFLVVFGEFAIGAALILGLFTRFAAAMGTLMMLLFFVAAWEFSNGIVNQHLTYAVVTFGLAIVGAGNYFGLDRVIGSRFSPTVRKWFLSGEPSEVAATA